MDVAIRRRLGEILTAQGYIDDAMLEHGLLEQEVQKKPLGQILLGLGYISLSQLNETLSLQAGIEPVDLDSVSVDSLVLGLVPAELVSKHNLMPFSRQNGCLEIAMTDPFDRAALEDLRVVTGLSVRRHYAHPAVLERAILKYYGSNVARMLENLAPHEQADLKLDGNGEISAAKLHELAREPSLVNLVNLILLEAIEARASDVHIEPFEHEIKTKYRIDGVLAERAPSPRRLQAAIVSRIKIMANMNIAERFVPQDGHIEFIGPSGKVDIRVSTVPTIFGESITMRLLDRSTSLMSLHDLGMDPRSLDGFSRCLEKAHGIILVTGPTGSGKTTTLYAGLNHIYSPEVKIITIEDPVEYQLDGVVQMPVNPKRGLTFATGLRHILRQDPDIIMVGEIRDHETADIAVRAALTGHLVFSTLHTNDAAGAVTRLIDMGVEPFLLGSSLEAVLAQRLVRKICPRCKKAYQPDTLTLKRLSPNNGLGEAARFYHGTGCNECLNTGLKGRVGIFELLRITDALRELIATRPTTEQIIRNAPPDHLFMRRDGIDKVLSGMTTPEEVLRATQDTEE